MISFKDFRKLDEARKGNPYNYEKDSGAKGLAHKVGDSVWAKHPTEKSKTIAGKVTKIGRTLTTLQHKDGTEATYPHADVSTDFSKLNPNPYRKNESEELDEAASTDNLPISNVHKHIQRFMGMDTSLNLAKHMKTGTATHTSWEKVNNGLKAIGVKPQHIATLAVKIRPAQYDEQEALDEGAIANIEKKLKDHAQRKIDHEAKFGQLNGADLHSHEVTRARLLQQKKKLQSAKMRAESVELDEAEGLTTKKNQNGGHDVYHNGTHIGHVEQKSMPWLRGKTIKKVFAKKPNGDSVVVDSDDSGKNTIESAKKTLLKHHLAESVELDEAMSPEQRAKLDDLIQDYQFASDPEADPYDNETADPDDILDQIKKEFGAKVAKQVEDGMMKMHYPRKNHTSGYDYLAAKNKVDRSTKAGKMFKQDSDYRKNTALSRLKHRGKISG